MKPTIIEQPADKMHPFFGYAWPRRNLIHIQADLPRFIKRFVLEHELFHLRDTAKGLIWREVRANFVAAGKHPIGFIGCAAMSLFQPYRLAYYAKWLWEQIFSGK